MDTVATLLVRCGGQSMYTVPATQVRHRTQTTRLHTVHSDWLLLLRNVTATCYGHVKLGLELGLEL